MDIRRRNMARIILNSLLAGALSALVCFAQSSPAAKSAGQSATPSSSASSKTTAESPHKVVLKVGSVQVTKSEIDYLIKNLSPQIQRAVAIRGRKPIGNEYAMMVLLSQKAKSEHLDTAPDFQRKMALDKLQLLAQEEYRIMEESTQVSPAEITSYYNAHKSDFEQAKIREFVVRKKEGDAKAGAPGLSATEAKARLASIQKAIEAGTPPKEVAKKFDVPNVVMVNPKPVTVRKGEMLPALDKVAFALKDKQFSQPVETAHAFVLMQMLDHERPTEKDVADQIKDHLRQQKLQAALDAMKAKANIWMDPVYFKTAEESPALKTPAVPGVSSAPAAAPKGPAHP